MYNRLIHLGVISCTRLYIMHIMLVTCLKGRVYELFIAYKELSHSMQARQRNLGRNIAETKFCRKNIGKFKKSTSLRKLNCIYCMWRWKKLHSLLGVWWTHTKIKQFKRIKLTTITQQSMRTYRRLCRKAMKKRSRRKAWPPPAPCRAALAAPRTGYQINVSRTVSAAILMLKNDAPWRFIALVNLWS